MGLATIRMRWSPEQFWSSTPHEFWAAVEAYELMNKKPSSSSST